MSCASARRIYGEVNGSPQGAFVLIGDFGYGKAVLVIMLLGISINNRSIVHVLTMVLLDLYYSFSLLHCMAMVGGNHVPRS